MTKITTELEFLDGDASGKQLGIHLHVPDHVSWRAEFTIDHATGTASPLVYRVDITDGGYSDPVDTVPADIRELAEHIKETALKDDCADLARPLLP